LPGAAQPGKASLPYLRCDQPIHEESISTAIETKSVFIVDDHPIFRRGLVGLIESEPGFKVCGEASTARGALEALRRSTSDVVVVDLSLPGSDGLDLMKSLRAEHPSLPFLVVSAYDEKIYALRALRAGASGYLMKRETDTAFLGALRKVLSGGIYVSPSLGDDLIFKVTRGSHHRGNSPLDRLTDRELEVLCMVGEEKDTRAIAGELHLSVKTIESHRLHIKEKLELKNATELIRFAAAFVQQREQ
jgi:DNA-binding NarL/FixJ family response regulator